MTKQLVYIAKEYYEDRVVAVKNLGEFLEQMGTGGGHMREMSRLILLLSHQGISSPQEEGRRELASARKKRISFLRGEGRSESTS